MFTTLKPNHIPRHCQPTTPFNVRNNTLLPMLKLTRFNICYHQPRPNPSINFQIIKPVSLTGTISPAMAEKAETTPPSTAEKIETTPLPTVAKELPPPPEKPEAGDCCGSGCVRCVWDVYYEELDAYDKIVKDFDSHKQ